MIKKRYAIAEKYSELKEQLLINCYFTAENQKRKTISKKRETKSSVIAITKIEISIWFAFFFFVI